MHQFEFTPKAFANFSPGFERSREPWGKIKIATKPWKGSPWEEPFQGSIAFLIMIPGFSLRSNPGLRLANAFGVISNWCTTSHSSPTAR